MKRNVKKTSAANEQKVEVSSNLPEDEDNSVIKFRPLLSEQPSQRPRGRIRYSKRHDPVVPNHSTQVNKPFTFGGDFKISAGNQSYCAVIPAFSIGATGKQQAVKARRARHSDASNPDRVNNVDIKMQPIEATAAAELTATQTTSSLDNQPPQLVSEVAQEEMPPYVVTVTVRVSPMDDAQSRDLKLSGTKSVPMVAAQPQTDLPFNSASDPATYGTAREIETAVDEFGSRLVIIDFSYL